MFRGAKEFNQPLIGIHLNYENFQMFLMAQLSSIRRFPGIPRKLIILLVFLETPNALINQLNGIFPGLL